MSIEEMIFSLALLGIGGTMLVFFYHIRSKNKREQIKIQKQQEKEKSKTEIIDGIDSLIKNAPRILEELDKAIDEMKKRGCTNEQLAPLLEKKKFAEMGVKYAPLWEMGGKKVIGSVLPLIKNRLGINF